MTSIAERAPASRPGAAIAIALPGLVLALACGVTLALAAAGRHPLWRAGDVTLSEAAAFRDLAEVARQVGMGTNPNLPYRVRVGVLPPPHDILVTPLEAAVAERRPDVIDLLFSLGASPTSLELRRLTCFAAAVADADTRAALARHAGSAPVDCQGVRLPW